LVASREGIRRHVRPELTCTLASTTAGCEFVRDQNGKRRDDLRALLDELRAWFGHAPPGISRRGSPSTRHAGV
jgi:hypothetical protein